MNNEEWAGVAETCGQERETNLVFLLWRANLKIIKIELK